MSTPINEVKAAVTAKVAGLEGDVKKAETQALGFVQSHYYWFILGAFIVGLVIGLRL